MVTAGMVAGERDGAKKCGNDWDGKWAATQGPLNTCRAGWMVQPCRDPGKDHSSPTARVDVQLRQRAGLIEDGASPAADTRKTKV